MCLITSVKCTESSFKLEDANSYLLPSRPVPVIPLFRDGAKFSQCSMESCTLKPNVIPER